MTGVSSNKSLRKALGSIKDTTTIGLAKVNSDYKNLDIAIVKATNHVERPAKEKHIKVIFGAISAVRPRADVAYCIHALARRLSKTSNWAVALKTLIVIHRALREVDRSFREELVNYGRSRSRMLNLARFKDDSSPSAWCYSAWIRVYALYLEERLECFRVLKYDVKTGQSRIKDLDTMDLLTHLPTLQQLLRRVLSCQPEGAAVHNYVIQLALSMVTSESMNIYGIINDGIVNLVDKFFQMPHQNAITALDIYRKAREQAERLSELYELCKTIDICRRERFVRIEQPPASIIQAMEEYVRDAARVSTYLKEQVKPVIEEKKEVLAIEDKKINEPDQKGVPSPPEQVLDEKVVAQPTDLLGLDEPIPVPADTDEMNVLALTVVPIDQPKATTPTPNLQNGATGWELSLVTTRTPSSNEPITAATKLGGGLDMLVLDSLYDDAVRRSSNHNINYGQRQPAGSQPNPRIKQAVATYDPFSASPAVSAMTDQQHQAYIWQQQQMMMKGQQQHPHKQPVNQFGYPNTYGSGMAVQAGNTFTGLI